MKKYFTAVPCFAVILMIAAGVEATTLIKLGDDEIATQADAIVVGRCMSAASQWVNGTLVTQILVQVHESLKGDAGAEMNLVIPGGVDTSREVPVSVVFPGAPSVFRDETVLLFLSDSVLVSGGYDVVGFSQGKYSVVEEDGHQMVTRGGETPVLLSEKKAQIEAALAEGQ